MPTTDLVVVLPGIMGSTLTHRGRPVWAPTAGALLQAIRVFGDHVGALRLPEGIGDDHPGDGVEPADLMPDLHALPGLWTPVKGYTPLLDHLNGLGYRQTRDGEPGNLLPVAYDWRLSNRYNARRLKTLVEPALARWQSRGGPYTDARIVFVCHSMGGLVARWYIEQEGGAEITRKLITLGTPYRGAAKALVQLVNGVPSTLGRLGPDLTVLARSFPSMHQLLPEYACISAGRDLIRTTDTNLPDLATAMVADAMAFHTTLHAAEQARGPAVTEMTHAIVGTTQNTTTTVTLNNGQATALDTYGPHNLHGDATVPLTGAVRNGIPLDSPLLRRIADKHGNLQRSPAALDEIEGVLTGQAVIVRALLPVKPTVTTPELLLAGEPLTVDVDLPANHAIKITVTSETGREVDRRVPRISHGHAHATITDLPPGAYTIDVTGTAPGSPIAPVSSDVIIWDPQP